MGYSVRVMRNGERPKNVSVSDYIRQVTISELSPLTEYHISVAAVNSNGTGVYSIDIPVATEGKQCQLMYTLAKILACTCYIYLSSTRYSWSDINYDQNNITEVS